MIELIGLHCKHRAALSLTALLTAAIAAVACGDERDAILVLAAASTIDAMEEATASYNADHRPPVEVSFGSTSVLARQLEEGAPADILLSASVEWADHVAGRVAVARRAVLMRNALVVVVPAAADPAPTTLGELAGDTSRARIAIADPASVPAGIYAAEALRAAGLWDVLAPRLIPALDVRAALTLVADGEADAGLVYASDAAAAGAAVRVLERIDPSLHTPIEYPLLLLEDARPEAAAFFDFLVSATGRAHFRRHGFIDAG